MFARGFGESSEVDSFQRWLQAPQMKKRRVLSSSASVTYVDRQRGQREVTDRV
jgi:hypothetical protein